MEFRHPVVPAARVLHQIRTIPSVSRGMVSSSLGYSQPSVTRQVRSLMDAGLVEELEAVHDDTRAGRPSSILGVNARHLTTWGIHIGLRSTAVTVSDGAGRVIREQALPIQISELSPEEALGQVYEGMISLGAGLPIPVSLGVAFSAHVGRGGLVSSTAYGWNGVEAPEILAGMFGQPVSYCSGVAAMAGRELAGTPISSTLSGQDDSSTLYFYAREMINHAWIINGAVHRPHTGLAATSFRDLAGSTRLGEAATGDGGHPLGNTAVLRAAARAGAPAADLSALVTLGNRNPVAREILDERAELLAQAILLSLELIDPARLVLAGEGFSVDRRGLRLVVDRIREHRGGPGHLGINLANGAVLCDAARLSGLHHFWEDPLGRMEGH